MSECEKCHGTGKVPCPKCGGKKEITCEKCNGHKHLNCSSCDGTGKVNCPSCDGSGKAISICSSCYKGRVEKSRLTYCPKCHGTGKIEDDTGCVCLSCGTRMLTQRCFRVHHGQCIMCGSTLGYKPVLKTCTECHGSGRITEKYYETCPDCHGEYRRKTDKKCNECGGSGKTKCSRCGGTGRAKCQNCTGSGKVNCDNCGGVGEVKCPDCEKREREAKERRERKEREEREAKEKKAAAEKAAKERKDTVIGCGCLLAIVAVIGFFIWWWMEGLNMAALSGMWEQTKGALGGGGLKAIASIGVGIVALLAVWRLIKGIKGKKGEVSTSPKKRWKFVVLGIVLGFFGVHLAYAKRWLLFLLLWAGFITGNVMSGGKPEADKTPAEATAQQVEPADNAKKNGGSPIGGIGFGIWALLWIGGTLFIKKDGKGNRM